MSSKRDEVWYCENSKGHKIAPYGDSIKDMIKEDKQEKSTFILAICISTLLVSIFILAAFGCLNF